MATHNIPGLPPRAELTYLAEGAANVVYRVRIPCDPERPSGDDSYGRGTPPPTELEEWQVDQADETSHPHSADGTVLRLRKAVPHTRSVGDALRLFEKQIMPRFKKDHLIRQTLVRVPEHVLEELNVRLRQEERDGARPEARRGTYLSNDPYGLVLPDMYHWPPGQRGVTLELKPKWLVQSPNAPSNAIRCRTCALKAMRGKGRSLCPLDLASAREAQVERALSGLSGAGKLKEYEDVWKAAVAQIAESSRSGLLAELRTMQGKLDSSGVLDATRVKDELLTAMTLRDCTLYIRVPTVPKGKCELVLGDLDLKAPERFGYWQEVEAKLIHGYWYVGETLEPVSEPANRCALGGPDRLA